MANEEISRTAEARNDSMSPVMTTGNEPGPALFRAPQPPSNVGFWAQMRPHLDLVSKLLPTVWSVFLLWGGLIFLVYFFSIGFMPEIDLKGLATLLAFSAVTAAWQLSVLGFYLLVPGLLWVKGPLNLEQLKPLWHEDGKFSGTLAMLWFGLPIFGAILSALLIPRWLIFGGVLVVVLIITSWFLWRKLPYDLNWKQKLTTVGIFCFFLLSTALTFVPLFLILDTLIGANPDLSKQSIFGIYTIFVSGIVVIVVANARLVDAGPLSLSWSFLSRYLISAAVAIFILFTLFHQWAFTAKWVMSSYKFGHFETASLVLDGVGCDILQHHGLQERRTSPDQKTCALTKATILSRLGNAHYVKVIRNDSPSMSFTIPTQNVLSWAVNEPNKPITAGVP